VYQFLLAVADAFDPERPNHPKADVSSAMAPTGFFTP
jgi:hypothetical protein